MRASRTNAGEEERILENFSIALRRREGKGKSFEPQFDGRRKSRKTTSPIPDDFDDEDMEDGEVEVYCLCKG